jgi:hypothetical protein
MQAMKEDSSQGLVGQLHSSGWLSDVFSLRLTFDTPEYVFACTSRIPFDFDYCPSLRDSASLLAIFWFLSSQLIYPSPLGRLSETVGLDC